MLYHGHETSRVMQEVKSQAWGGEEGKTGLGGHRTHTPQFPMGLCEPF